MSFNDAPPSSGSITDHNLEAQLRGMILSNDQTGTPHEPAPGQRPGSFHHIQPYQQRQPVPFYGIPGNRTGPVANFNQLPHPTAQISGLSPISPMNSNLLSVTQGLPPPEFFFQEGDFTNVPAPPAPYQLYPGPPPALQTTGLPPLTSLQYSPSQRPVPRSQSPNMSPNTPPHQDYMPPHMRHIYGQQPTSPQNVSPPVRQRSQPPQMMPMQQPRTPPHHRGRSRQFNNPQHISRAPPPTALDHFPPLGALPTKTNSPPLNPHYQQQTAQKPQQRAQYQPLPINTRNFDSPARGGPVRGNFHTPGHAGRPTQQYIEQISAEQSHYLNEFSKRVIAEAAPPASETSVKHALLRRLEAICREVSPDAKLIPFGSLVSKCTLRQTSPITRFLATCIS